MSLSKKQRWLQALHNDSGVAAVELAIILPVMMLVIFGTAELACQIYVRGNMHLVVRQAARDSIVGTANLEAIEKNLRKKIEILPGIEKGAGLAISICQQEGCDAGTAKVSELTGDTNSNGVCDTGENFTDFNRNGIAEKAGAVVTGNSLGGPNDPVVFEVSGRVRYFFGSLSMLGEIKEANQVHNFSVRSVGTNEEFESPVIACP
jgi:Flp pilus assembly protein TadG